MKNFTVISAPEFIKTGPPLGSREHKRSLAAELRARDEREADAQRRREDDHARRERMTPAERVYDDLEMLCEMNDTQKTGLNWKLRKAIAETWQLIEELEK